MWKYQLTLILLLAGCEASGDYASDSPMDHFFATDAPLTFSTGYKDTPFSVPTEASVSWQIDDRSSGSADSYSAAVVPESEFGYFKSGQKFSAYAIKVGTAPGALSESIPAGDYHFVVRCTNIIETCQFSYTLSAFY